MNFAIIENFLSEDKSEKLISFSKKFLENNNEAISYHGNRTEVFSTHNSFDKMIIGSKEWEDLNNYFFSQKFFDFACKKLMIKNINFELTKFYNLKKYDALNRSRKNVSLIADNELIKIYLSRKFRQLISKIKFNSFFNKKKYLELLYGISRAGNSYKQAIHRDSDSRLIIFLLYLNDISDEGIGGNLDIYKKIGKIENIENPNLSSIEKVKSITPKAGRMVLFQNQDDAYHGVEIMKNHKNFRYFIYGSFTLLNEKSPYISKKQIPSEFFLY